VPIGRDSSNTLAISDPSLSRRHCVLTCDGEQWTIRDLESRNGTFVNGAAVRESRVRHGDQISLGDSIFILLLHDDAEIVPQTQVELDDSPAQATAQLSPRDALYLQPERVLKALPETSRVARDLNALLKISRMVHAIRDPEQLQREVLDSIFEVVPAERGAVLMDSLGEGRFGSVVARNRTGAAQPVRVSRTIARQVLETGTAVLGADVAGLQSVESLVVSNVRSLLCVPLSLFEKNNGCIYLDTTNPACRFDDGHLQLVTAVAGISAAALENARRVQRLEQENLRLTTEANLEHNMVGEGARMKQVYEFLARVAPKDSTVLIEGESGTGKELAARAIHRNSPRSDRPFVAINCAAIPEGLLESELFGHERGAFTDALTQKKGRLEVANGGIVFLDEIGELAPALQVKLLRVLQEREFERVGGNRPVCVDIRLIAATNRNLEDAVKAGSFRLDLYYRLNVVSLRMPPLRERREDIESLTHYFLGKFCKKCKVRTKTISAEAMACLMQYDWPGNVRELENAIERAVVLSSSDLLHADDLPESLLEKNLAAVKKARYHSTLLEVKKQLIVDAMEDAAGNYSEAARNLGVHVNYLHRLIRNLELKESLRLAAERRRGGQKIAGVRL
jgi:Nif-specific regulatory protein